MIESIKQVWRMPWHFACAGKEASSVSGQRHLCLNSECQCFATVVVALTFIVVILLNCYSYCDGGIAIGIVVIVIGSAASTATSARRSRRKEELSMFSVGIPKCPLSQKRSISIKSINLKSERE